MKYHPSQKPPRSRTQKACKACHNRKERCDGESPCGRCQRRGILCSRWRGGEYTIADPPAQDADVLLASRLVDPIPQTSGWVGLEFVQIYFRNFHPIWPILHQGTCDLSKEPCVLVQSMVMIGLWVKGSRESRETAMRFHRKLLSAIHDQKSQWYVPATTQRRNTKISWPMATYQSILLQLIFAVLVAKQESTFDLNLRIYLSPPIYDLLTSLVETCRSLGLFNYPTMLAHHDSSAPVALVWVSVEECKRFGLAVYKLCRLCAQATPDAAARDDFGSRSELLTLADLDFCMPDSDEMWNAAAGLGREQFRSMATQHTCGRDNGNPDGWISRTSGRLCDSRVNFDWI